MDNLDGILKLVENEFDAIIRNGKFRSREEIDSVYKLIDIAKDIYCIWDYEKEDDGLSYREREYDDSYARGRGRNAKRDRMGRYASDGYRGYSHGKDKHEYIEHLREMMEDAPDDQTRQSIQRMIQQIEN